MTSQHFTATIPKYILDSKLFYVVILNNNGKSVYENALFKNTFDNILSPKKYLINYIFDDDKLLFTTTFAQALHKGSAKIEKPLRMTSKHQLCKWFEWEFSLYETLDTTYVLGIGYDVSPLEEARNKVHQFSHKLNMMLDSTTDGIYLLNNQWEFIQVNKVTETLLGLHASYLIGKNLWELYPNDKEYQYPQLFRKAMEECVVVNFEEYRADLHKWFEVVAYPLPEGLMIIFKDKTERKIMQEQLKKSEQKLRAILDSTTDSNIMIGADYKVMCFNKVAYQETLFFFGKELQEGQNFLDYLLPDTRQDFFQHFHTALNGIPITTDIELHFENNRHVWFKATYAPVYGGSNIIGVTFNTTNIDESKRAALKIQEQNTYLRNIAWLQSHTVRRPVANILGLVDLLQNDQDKEENLQMLEASALELDGIIRDIILLSHELRKK